MQGVLGHTAQFVRMWLCLPSAGDAPGACWQRCSHSVKLILCVSLTVVQEYFRGWAANTSNFASACCYRSFLCTKSLVVRNVFNKSSTESLALLVIVVAHERNVEAWNRCTALSSEDALCFQFKVAAIHVLEALGTAIYDSHIRHTHVHNLAGPSTNAHKFTAQIAEDDHTAELPCEMARGRKVWPCFLTG